MARKRLLNSWFWIVIGWLLGWTLVTFGLSSLLTWEVWPLSVGALLLGLVGYRFMAEILWYGLYTLNQEPEEEMDHERIE